MTHTECKTIIKRHSDFVAGSFHLYIDVIPEKKLKTAIKEFGRGCLEDDVFALYDTTVLDSGKQGYLFCTKYVCYREVLGSPQKIWLRDIEKMEIQGKSKAKDCDKTLVIYLRDGSFRKWNTKHINKTPMIALLQELISYDRGKTTLRKSNIPLRHKTQLLDYGVISAGYAAGAFGNINKQYEEEKFHAEQGHGFAAERANTLYDRLKGYDAKIIGDDNKLNGPDRLVDGVKIQSKYYQTGKGCVDSCFDDYGTFRYIDPESGRPMQIEVPSDKYQEAVNRMVEKIREGRIPGVTDPEEAKNIIRKGHFTYTQARNLAKAGTIESLMYDSIHGVVYATSAFGVTATITLAYSLWNGDSKEIALKKAAFSGLKVGGTTFIVTVLSSQISKAGLNSLLVGSSETIIALMGPKASALLINSFRIGQKSIYGAAAMKSAAKLLRGNVITGSVAVAAFSSVDVINIFRGRISGKQLFKNLGTNASTVAGGTGGWMGGAALGAKAGAVIGGPVGGTIGAAIGGVGGAALAGGAAGKAANTVLGAFIEDDAEEMVRIIEQEFVALADEYLLMQIEVEKVTDYLQSSLTCAKLRDMYASSGRKEYAKSLLIPIIEKVTADREIISAITSEDMNLGLREALEELSDYL